MNRNHVAQIMNIDGINLYQRVIDNNWCKFTYFNPHTSEMVEFDCHIAGTHNHYDMHIYNVRQFVKGNMIVHHQNYIKPFRSFILATLIGGIKRHNNVRLILCKSESAARNYSNLGGVIICIKNPKNGQQWGVVK